MKLLLDTHVLLWWYVRKAKLAVSTQEIIASADIVYASVVSAWELAEKTRKGKMNLPLPLSHIMKLDLFTDLPVKFEHVETYQKLTTFHKDPFDRMLVAQALCEGLVLISADKEIGQYPIQIIRP